MKMFRLMEESLLAVRDAFRASQQANEITITLMQVRIERERELARFDAENNGRAREAFAITIERLRTSLATAKATAGL